jgi:hypothetical protein
VAEALDAVLRQVEGIRSIRWYATTFDRDHGATWFETPLA